MHQCAGGRRTRRLLQETHNGDARPRSSRSSSTAACLLLACSLLLVLAPRAHAQAANTTAPSDAAALADVLDALTPHADSILATWTAGTDPCDSWEGVICSCADLPIRSLASACASTFNASAQQHLRVLGLDLGPTANADGQKLEGPIPPAVGGLLELLYLDLSDNELRDSVPNTLSSLVKLQWLLLDNNQLTGALPAFLGDLPALKQAQLQHNSFSGPVPVQWCSGQATYHVAHNNLLCGSVPVCFQGLLSTRIRDIEGTYLTGLNSVSTGGACDATPPDCDTNLGCLVWTPKYWTSRSILTFNFTGFLDYESGITHYQWGIGTRKESADVVPLTNATTTRVLKDIRDAVGNTQRMYVTPVVRNLTTTALLEGQRYYVTVVAWNGAGPPLSSNFSSEAVMVDTTGPVGGDVVNTLANQQYSSTIVTDLLSASWDAFTDPESGIKSYAVDFLAVSTNALDGSITYKKLVDTVYTDADTTQVQVKLKVPLPLGTTYVVQVTGTNDAFMTTTAQTLPVTVTRPGPPTVTAELVTALVVVSSVFCLFAGAAAAVRYMKHRMDRAQAQQRLRAEEVKQLKQLMSALSSHGDGDEAGTGGAPLASPRRAGFNLENREMAFVLTDIESSTELSSRDGRAFKQLQNIHDSIIREAIAKHGGYEICTEGDSFQIAFGSCHAALAMAMDVQYRLLEANWPKNVLAQNACRVVTDDENSQVLFAGPRVRMGLHWAREGTVEIRNNIVARHKAYEGQAWSLVSEISDAANGGQVVLSEEAVEQLSDDLSLAGFPIIKLLGMFQLSCAPSPVYLYGCTEVVGRPLKRQFTELRKIKQQWPALGQTPPHVLEYNLMRGPLPYKDSRLMFVVMRLTNHPKGTKVTDLPTSLAAKFEAVFGMSAQQFRGYLFNTEKGGFSKGIWAAAFSSGMDAVRFSHAAQMLLMYVRWTNAEQRWCGAAVLGADGRLLFSGPRVAMAIHETNDYNVYDDKFVGSGAPHMPVCFMGAGVTLPLVITYAGRGGQVILSQDAWDAVKPVVTKHPGAMSFLSLGQHIVSDDFPKPMMLMEVMPNLLAGRSFGAPVTRRMLQPGFRDAPKPEAPMAIVFVKVAKPDMVVTAEKGVGLPEEIKAITTTYQDAVGVYAALARKLLHKYNGYECKEPEPGKFTIAFSKLENAICWACHLQEEMLYLKWPEALLAMPGCEPLVDREGILIWCGLRIKVGMAWGMINSQKPLNTGRADYFGELANGAARVSVLAAPGQVLFDPTIPWLDDDRRPVLGDHLPQLQLLYDPLDRTAVRMCEHDARVSAHNNRASAAATRQGSASDLRGGSASDLRGSAAGPRQGSVAAGTRQGSANDLRGFAPGPLQGSASDLRGCTPGPQQGSATDLRAPAPGPLQGTACDLRASAPGPQQGSVADLRRPVSGRPQMSAYDLRGFARATPPPPEPVSEFRLVSMHEKGRYQLRGLDRTRLLYAAHTRRLAARADLDVQQQAWVPSAEPSVAQLGLRLPSFVSRPSGFVRTLSNKVMAAGRRSSSPHSPTGVEALTRSSLSQPGVPGGRAPFTAGGGVCDEGPVRSRSSLSAGGSVGSLVNTLGKGLRGNGLSEAGRAGFGASSLHGSWLSGGFARPRSPQLTHTSRSESAAAGAILQSAQRLAELRGGPVNSTQGPAVIDAAEQPEGDSGGMSAAAAGRTAELASARREGGSAPWLVDGSCDGAGAWEVGSTGAGRHGSSTQLDAQEGSASLQPNQGLNDPLLGTVHIPPIHTSAPLVGDWSGSLAGAGAASSSVCRSDSGSPFSLLQSDTPGSPSMPLVKVLSNQVAKPAQQQPYQQLQQQHRLRSTQLQQQGSGGGGEACPPGGADPAACLQPWQQQNETWHERQHELSQWQVQQAGWVGVGGSNNGGLFCNDYGTPVSLSTTMTSCMDTEEMMRAQQQSAVANMQRQVAQKEPTEVSQKSFSAAGGMSRVIGGLARIRLPGSSGGGGSPRQTIKSLFAKVVGRSGTGMHSGAGSCTQMQAAGGRMSDDDSIDEEVVAVQQQHGMVRAASPSSMSQTPCSSAPGSRGGTGGGADQFLSPNHLFAAEYGQTFSSQQQPSNGSLAAGVSASIHSALDCAGSNAEGSLAGGPGLTDSSFSKGGGNYTIAESSYSPTHCRPGANPVEIWQGYGHQQDLLPDSSVSAPQEQQQHQQQQALPAKLSVLCGEPSLRPPQGWCSPTAAALAADAAATTAPAVDASGVTLQLPTAAGGLQPQGSDFSLQPLQPLQPPPRQQQVPGGQGTQPGAGQALQASQQVRQDASVHPLAPKTSDSPKTAPQLIVQDRHNSHTSVGSRTEHQGSHTSVGPRAELLRAGPGDSLQLRQGSAERPNRAQLLSIAAHQAKQAQELGVGMTAAEYHAHILRLRASPTRPTLMSAAFQSGPAEAPALWQGPAVLQPASLPRPQQDEQQLAMPQVSASPQRQAPGAQQQQQQQQQHSTATQQQQQQQQHTPRPSPLGPSKAPAQLLGRMERQAGSGNGSVHGAGAGTAASGPQANLAAEQQMLSGIGSGAPAVPNVAAEARQVLAGAVNAQQRPQQSTSPRASSSPRSVLQQAAAAAAAAGARAAPPAGQLAVPDAGPCGSNCSSGNNSPRSAPSGLQRLPSNALSLRSCVENSGQGSPRSSLPNTPRSLQRASLGNGSFVSASGSAAPGSPSGRAGSSSSMAGLGAQQQQQQQPAWAGQAAAAEVADSDDFDDEDPSGLFCGPGGASSAGRARTPSGSMLAPKEALGAIPELPAAFESRTSDPSDAREH